LLSFCLVGFDFVYVLSRQHKLIDFLLNVLKYICIWPGHDSLGPFLVSFVECRMQSKLCSSSSTWSSISCWM